MPTAGTGTFGGLFRRSAPKAEPAAAPPASAGFEAIFGTAARARSAENPAPAQVPPEIEAPAAPAPAGLAPPAPTRSEPLDPELAAIAARHRGAHYLCPTDLCVQPPKPQRVALVGSCFLHVLRLHDRRPDGCRVDLFLTNNAAELPAQPDGDYDFQVVQIALRSVFDDSLIWHIPFDDEAGHQKALEKAVRRLEFQLQENMRWNTEHGLLTFVMNFPVPQRNALGVLMPRYDLRNPEYFIDRLNEHVERLVRSYRNAYLLDIDRICAAHGRRYVQDDGFMTIAHGGMMPLWGPNANRAEPVAPTAEHYEITWQHHFPQAVWEEACLMFRTVRQSDAVKLVIVDLDDTLWNGISGEADAVDAGMVEGWPIGLAEALAYLKKRGVLLAIASRNDEARIRAIWPILFRHRLRLDDFVAVRINWAPKAENVAEILAAVNLLPRNTVFIDDSPAERAAVQQAFPDIRVLGRHPYYLKRILLWSSETQTASITAESARRSEMVQAQIVRESTKTKLSRADFLAEAAPKVTIVWLGGASDPRFARAFELINKTNQFNTTGQRWTAETMGGFLAGGGRILAFEVADSFTSYGLVGAVLVRDASVEQWTMSCRVLGYDVEIAVMADLVTRLRAEGATEIRGRLVETEVNFPCRELVAKSGFVLRGDSWVLAAGAAPPRPGHVAVAP